MIPGITDRTRLPRLGKIRLGEKRQSKSGKEYPAATDHFVFDDVPEVREKYGDECRELFPVMLPADDEEIWFPTSRSAYGKSGLFCRCSDGETALRVFRKEDAQGSAYLRSTGQTPREGELYELPCPGEACPYMERGYCRNLGRLFIILPDVPRFGVYEIATSSINSIRNVLGVARAVRSMLGRVAGVPFALKLEPLQVQPDGRAKTVWVLNLECRASLAQLASIGRRLRAGGGPLALIEAPDDTPEDLYPVGGARLDAALGPGAAAPPPRNLEDLKAELGTSGRPAERPRAQEREATTPQPADRAPEPAVGSDEARDSEQPSLIDF